MRLLFVHTHVQQHCGISALIRIQARALRARGHAVFVAGLDTQVARDYLADTDLDNADLDNAVPFVGLPLDQYAKTPANFVRSLWGLIALIRRERIDVVVASHRWAGTVAFLATRVTRSRLVSVDHGVLWGNRRFTTWGDGLVAVSENSRRHLMDYFGVPAQQIRLIRNAIRPVERASTETQHALRAELGLDADQHQPLLLSVGRLDENKGIHYLLDALPQIIGHLPTVHLIVVGTGEMAEALADQADALGIAEHVTFTGLRADVATFLSVADMFVIPSQSEGIPISMLEAMSVGLPVVGSEVGGIPEVMALSAVEAGVLVAPRDGAALGDAIVALWQDPARYARAASAARAVVCDHFSAAAMVDQMEVYLHTFV